MRILFLAISLVLISLTGVTAATKELSQNIYSVIGWENTSPSIETRRNFAVAIQEYWIEFEQRVPRLSPSEKEWIEGELSASGKRQSRAFESREFALRSLNKHTDVCLSNIEKVLASQEFETKQQLEIFLRGVPKRQNGLGFFSGFARINT